MEDSQRSSLQALADEADGLADEVDAAFEEHASPSFQRETRRKVDDLSRRYREAIAQISDEKERFQIERTAGRRVSDLSKMASRLPAPPEGKPAEKAADTSFFGTRAPKSSRPPFVPGLQPGEVPRRDRNLVRVTSEIDAWCGRCNMVRTQTVAAVVGDQPAQVVCTVCGSRSRYREGPARAKKDEGGEARASRSAPTTAQKATDAKQKEKNELLATLQSAENVRKYDPKERYRVGEIIDHPEHGRGKIENTLPRSLLVRFAGGLKPVKLG
jgi:hypothetical protein